MMKSLRVLLYADFRSPHAVGMWEGLSASGVVVMPVSSESVDIEGVISPEDMLSTMKREGAQSKQRPLHLPAVRSISERSTGRMTVRRKVRGNAAFIAAVARFGPRLAILRATAKEFRPTLVHGLRIPYEGVTLTCALGGEYPVVLSTWGSDFYYQGWDCLPARPLIARAVKRASGLHYDNPMDFHRAQKLGLHSSVPTIFAAGNFGATLPSSAIAAGTRVPKRILFGRGGHPIYRPELAVAVARRLVSERFTFAFIGCEGVPEVVAFANDFPSVVDMFPRVGKEEFASHLSAADIFLSPAISDGTPNSLIEASVAGAWVVATDLPQLRLVKVLIPNLVLTAHDPDCIAASIRELVGEERMPPVLFGPFDRRENSGRFLDFYQRVLA